jgi:hypothetical protein
LKTDKYGSPNNILGVKIMSETSQFSSKDIKSWLEKETSAILTPVQEQAQKLRDDMRDAILSVTDVNKMLFDNSSKEIEKRNKRVYNRARAMNKLARLFSDRVRKITVPDEIAYDSLNKFAQETQKAFMVTDIDIKNWFPRISPFFIMDRRKFLAVYEKAKESLTVLNDFLTNEYVKTKTLEETFQLIDELHNMEEQLSNIEAEKAAIKNERLPIEKEIAEREQKIAELKREGPVDQLFFVEAEIEKITKELKHFMRHLQKPFKKMQALALYRGGAGLTADERDKLNNYLQNPFKALATEELGYPVLKQILKKMISLINEGKLKLKADKKRKAEQDVDGMLNRDSLGKIHRRCIEVANREKQILNSEKMEETKRSLSTFQEEKRRLKVRLARVEAHEAVKKRTRNELASRISSHKRAIEKNLQSSLEQRVEVL